MMNPLRHLWRYLDKVYHISARVRRVRDRRTYPQIPSAAVHFTFLLGALLRRPSLLKD